MKVNFFIIGQPKSGTTALYDYLKFHPDLFLPEQKQLYYFATDHNEERKSKKKYNRRYYKKYYNYSIKDYIKHFDFSKGHKYFCDITPDYIYSKTAPQEIFNYNPNAKIVLIIREPISFLKSFHNQMINSNCETILDFWKAVDMEEERKKDIELNDSSCPKAFFYYKELIDYLQYIKPWYNLFGGNFKIILYESFRKDNFKTLDSLYQFLGVDFYTQDKIIKSNISVQAKKSGIIDKIMDFYLFRILSSLMPNRIKRDIKELVHSHSSNKKIDSLKNNIEINHIDNELMSAIKENIINLETYINTNNIALDGREVDLLNLWKYD